MPAVSVLTALPSRTNSGLMLAASCSRPGWIDAEGPQLNAVTLDRLDQLRLAGLLINGEDRNIVLAAIEDLSAFEVHLVLIAVGEVDEAAVRMDVDCSRALTRFDIGGVGQALLHEQRTAAQHAVGLKLVGIEVVLPLDRDIDPRLARMKIEMARPEAQAARGCHRSEVLQRAVLECEELERARVFGFSIGGVVAARDQDRRVVVSRRADLMRVD